MSTSKVVSFDNTIFLVYEISTLYARVLIDFFGSVEPKPIRFI